MLTQHEWPLMTNVNRYDKPQENASSFQAQLHQSMTNVQEDEIPPEIPPVDINEIPPVDTNEIPPVDTIKNIEHIQTMEIPKNGFECLNCGYSAKRKYTLKIHQEQHCRYSRPLKDKICIICSKRYTHNGLRSHLRGFMKKNRKKRGVHSLFSDKQHELYLKEIRLRDLDLRK